MDARFMRRVIDLRRKCDFPFILSSAVRCPAHNAVVSTTGLHGPHTPISIAGSPPTGHSVDVRVYGYRAAKLVSLAWKYGMTGVGLGQKGARGTRFVHIDDLPDAPGRPRPWVWTY